jgi:hypothetical protein
VPLPYLAPLDAARQFVGGEGLLGHNSGNLVSRRALPSGMALNCVLVLVIATRVVGAE